MDLQLKGLNVAISGTSQGIGRAIAIEFAKEGANLSICARSEGPLREVEDELSAMTSTVFATPVDVFERKEFEAWISETVQQLGGLDIFVANVTSGSATMADAAKTDLVAQTEQFEIVLPHLRKSQTASIVYISSIAGSVATPQFAQYGAMKAALTHYVKSLSKQVVADGIRVNSVAPGDIICPGNVWDKVRQSKPDVFERVLARNPRGSLGSPEEVAKVVTFVASPAASLISGANMIVDGGGTDHVQI